MKKMENRISEVQIIPIKPKDGLIAFASILLDEKLYLSSIGLHRKLNGSGFRITYPNKRVGNRNIDIFHPINRELALEIEKTILEKATKIFD